MMDSELLHSPLVPSEIVPLIEKASRIHIPVLVLGEEGTGKELVAKLIHSTGTWCTFRFHKMDCKFLSEDAFLEQLGRHFREIQYGMIPSTLYLKEVGYLQPTSQLRLLEVLEDAVFRNGIDSRTVQNLRVIASSSEDLKTKVSQGRFSEDLYHRLTTLAISIPPLRNRAKEIQGIAEFLLTQYAKKLDVKPIGISNDALRLLESYWWPGNLKEVEHLIIRSAIFAEGEQLTEKDLFSRVEGGKQPLGSLLEKTEGRSGGPERERLREEQNTPSVPVFFIDLVHRIKNPLVSIKTFTQLLREKFGDAEYRDYFYRIVTEDVEKIDDVLNGLLSYIRINTPIKKTNTVNAIVEEIIKKHEEQLQGKRIRIFKKLEKDLPETVVHDEQLKYILTSIVRYAMPSIPPDGTIGFLTKAFDGHKEARERKTSLERDGRGIEILILFTGCRKPVDFYEATLGISTVPKEEAIELELRLVKQIIEKNRGTMSFEVNEKKSRTLISLRFPIERRKVVYYPSVTP